MERISPAVILKNTKQGIRKMQEIKIVVDGKEYVKTKYTGEDWLHMLDYIEGAASSIPRKLSVLQKNARSSSELRKI